MKKIEFLRNVLKDTYGVESVGVVSRGKYEQVITRSYSKISINKVSFKRKINNRFSRLFTYTFTDANPNYDDEYKNTYFNRVEVFNNAIKCLCKIFDISIACSIDVYGLSDESEIITLGRKLNSCYSIIVDILFENQEKDCNVDKEIKRDAPKIKAILEKGLDTNNLERVSLENTSDDNPQDSLVNNQECNLEENTQALSENSQDDSLGENPQALSENRQDGDLEENSQALSKNIQDDNLENKSDDILNNNIGYKIGIIPDYTIRHILLSEEQSEILKNEIEFINSRLNDIKEYEPNEELLLDCFRKLRYKKFEFKFNLDETLKKHSLETAQRINDLFFKDDSKYKESLRWQELWGHVREYIYVLKKIIG